MKRNIILLFVIFLIAILLITLLHVKRQEALASQSTNNQEMAVPPTPKEFLKQEIEKADLTDRDYLIMQEIIFCESSWEQYWKTTTTNHVAGEVKVSTGNIGLAQINRRAHHEEYEKLGLDPYDPLQNIQYAVILYKRNGIKDWEKWSGHCFIPRLEKIGIIIK